MSTAIATPQVGLIDCTNEEHHAIRALSNSGMRDLSVSPLRYWFHWINPAPKPEEEEESKALRMGTALHCAVLESPETFDSRYVRELDANDWPVCLSTVPDIRQWVDDKGGKCKGTSKEAVIASALEFMKARNEFVPILAEEERRFFAENKGKTILTVEEWERVAGMTQALNEEPALRPILAKGKPEQTIVARDPETGVLLKARLDWMAPCHTLDLKTFTQKRGKSIDRSIADSIYFEGYYRQIYFYDMVRRLALGEGHDRTQNVMAFVESDQPHEVRIKRFTPKTGSEPNLYWLRAGLEIRDMIRLYADCLAKYGEKPWREPQEIAAFSDEDVKQFVWD